MLLCLLLMVSPWIDTNNSSLTHARHHLYTACPPPTPPPFRGTVTRAQFCRNVYGLLAAPGGSGGGGSSSMGGEYEAGLLARAFAAQNGLDVSYR